MNNIEQELKDIFLDTIEPLRINLFRGKEEYDDLICVFSNTGEYKAGDEKSIYDLFPLIRALSLKADLFSPDLRNTVYSSDKNKLCVILEWLENSKKVCLVNLDNLQSFEEKKFIDILSSHREKLVAIFPENKKTDQEIR